MGGSLDALDHLARLEKLELREWQESQEVRERLVILEEMQSECPELRVMQEEMECLA